MSFCFFLLNPCDIVLRNNRELAYYQGSVDEMTTNNFHTGLTPRRSDFAAASNISTTAKDELRNLDDGDRQAVIAREMPALDPLDTMLAELPFQWDAQLASVPTPRSRSATTPVGKLSGLSVNTDAASGWHESSSGLASMSGFSNVHLQTPLGLPWSAIERELAQNLPFSTQANPFACPNDVAENVYAPCGYDALASYSGPSRTPHSSLNDASAPQLRQHGSDDEVAASSSYFSTGLTPTSGRFDIFAVLKTPKPLPTPAIPGWNKRRVSFALPTGPPDIALQPAPKKQKRINPRSYNELPQKDASKPWVRTNRGTLGKTSRTSKINKYRAELVYAKVEHPLGPWGRWKYNRFMELTDCSISATSLKDFIYNHPITPTCKLTLFIQRSPADSKRRYETITHDKCKLRGCPMRVLGARSIKDGGTILHGHYRVAFDELWAAHGSVVDPFHTAGYVHLYCLEKFLDLPEICRLPNVDVVGDERCLNQEPNGSFAAALGENEASIVESFISLAQIDALDLDEKWCRYPAHKQNPSASGGGTVTSKEHKLTLNYALQTAKNLSRNSRVMSNMKASNVAVHRGDLEVYVRGRQDDVVVASDT